MSDHVVERSPDTRDDGATWPADAEHLSAIRAHTRHRLAGHGLDSDGVDDAVLAVNEAVINAVEHAYGTAVPGTVTVAFRAAHGSVRVDVSDHGSWRPRPRDAGDRGHGIRLMQGLVDSVSIRAGRAGTVVRLRIARAGPRR